MKKFGIVKCRETYDNWGDTLYQPSSIEWHELEDEQALKLRQNLHRLNTSDFCYHYVEYVDRTEIGTIMERINDLFKKDEEKALQRSAAAKKAAAAREASKIEKKRKQLLKLKKELGEV